MGIDIDAEKCTGCAICELVCSLFHEKEFNPKRARIKIISRERIGLNIPTTCNQCRECLPSCPEGAISEDTSLKVMLVDVGKCTGCRLCIDACHMQAIHLDPVGGTALVCDLCNGDPQCVKWCPTGAVRYVPGGIPAVQRCGKDYLPNLARSIAAKWGVPL